MTERRRVGRPPLVEGQRAEPVSTTLPADVFALLCRLARRRDLPVSELVRVAVLRMYHDERGAIRVTTPQSRV